MTSYRAFLDVASALSVPDRCPGCGAGGLRAVADGEQTHFRCPECGQLWHIELGWAVAVTTGEPDTPVVGAAAGAVGAD